MTKVFRMPIVSAARDEHRNVVDAWGAPEPVEIVAFDPGGSVDPRRADHDRVITTPRIYAPPGCTLKPRDLCVARGHVYTVDGEPAEWIDEDDTPVGVVVNLRRVDG